MFFTGKDNKAMMDDFFLAIGACQMGYCKYHKRRTYKLFGIDTDEYMTLVEKCPPGEADIRLAIDEMLERTSKRSAGDNGLSY